MPVLVDGDDVIPDSTRILRHLEERYPEPPLFPRDPARRAELDVFLEWFNEVWKVAPNAIEDELEREQPDHERVAARARACAPGSTSSRSMLDGRDHLFGDFSAADCAAFPFLKYAQAAATLPTTSSSTASSRSTCGSTAGTRACRPGSTA